MKRWMQALAALLLLAGFIAPTTIARAQDAPKTDDKGDKTTEATEDATFKDGKHSLSFENLGGLMFVKVKINDKGPYDFLFDSGAQISVISARLAKELELEMGEMPGGGMQGVGKADAKATVVEKFDIGLFKRGKTGAGSLDMDHVSGGLGRHMMGIIGQNIMKQMKQIEIDFSTSRLSFTLYPEDEMPVDQTEQIIISTVEGGEMPGIPGLPGLPGPGNRPPKKEPEEPGKDDEFSAPAIGPTHSWLFQDGTRTEAKAEPRQPKDGMTLSYTTGEFTIPVLNQTLEITPFWHVTAQINGKSHRFMFDTGASTLLVLADSFIEEQKLATSFGFMVKGVAEGKASAGLVDTFELGSVKETDVAFMSNALFKVSDQVREQLGPLGRFMQGLDALDFEGIIGISFCHRFKKTIVDTVEKTLRFEPWGDTENAVSPYEGEDHMKQAVIRTWNAKAGTAGLVGDSVPLHEWKDKGLETGGMVVKSVEADGPAAKAGIKEGDIITHLIDPKEGEVPMRDGPELVVYGCLNDPGSKMTLRLLRDGKAKDVEVTLATYAWKGTFPERFKDK